MTLPIFQMSGYEIAQAIQNRQVSCIQVIDAFFKHIEFANKYCNAFSNLDHEGALHAAAKADEMIKSEQKCGPLHGVPFTVKDLLSTNSIPTTYCSKAFEHHRPDKNAVAVARMIDAGAILIGKTTTPEFALQVSTRSGLCGTTFNPWSLKHSPGGSSGGSAVAVATGMGPLSVSTDGGGSARIPAAACGVLGLKPTIGAIPNETWPFLFGNNSTVSINTRCVEDVALMWNVMSGSHALDPWSRRPIRQLIATQDRHSILKEHKALFVENMAGNEPDPEILDVVSSMLRKLKGHLASIRQDADDIAPDLRDFDVSIALNMLTVNIATRIREMTSEQQALLDPALGPLLDKQRYQPNAVTLQSEAIIRSKLYKQLERHFETYNFIITPTVTAEPPLADAAHDGHVVINGKRCPISKWWSHLSIANLTGHPAISIPCGFTRSGFPVGLHAIGRWDDEQSLIDLASTVHDLFSWTDYWPALQT